MDRKSPQRRRIRLKPGTYTQIGLICSITIAVKGRRPVFASPAVADAAVDVLRAFWQASFWDHFLRGDERLEQVIEYVLNNPVRTGLVERWDEYRFSGSTVFELVDPGGGQAPALRVRPPR